MHPSSGPPAAETELKYTSRESIELRVLLVYRDGHPLAAYGAA